MTKKEIYDRYVNYMWETYGPFQGNPETYTYANFWKMVQTNAYFAKMFTGKKIKKED